LLAGQRKKFDKKKPTEERFQDYQETAFDELLAHHRFNLEIPYNKVTTVEITRGFFQTRLTFHFNSSSSRGQTLHFTLAKDQVPDARKLLNLALPLKIKKE
jgi:hypothetical protein